MADGNAQNDLATVPPVLDMLVVGGGPAGTAAAFRARELGLSVLVIDQDEVLSILRDWISPEGDPAKDKPVDSSYGPGGKKVPFPSGAKLIEQLVYGDQVPAGELYRKWKGVYEENGIPTLPGTELTGLATGGDGLLVARCAQQRGKDEPLYKARSVVLAMGRGVPTTLTIPGDTRGINYRLR